jgi:hypothetical protein
MDMNITIFWEYYTNGMLNEDDQEFVLAEILEVFCGTLKNTKPQILD